MKTDWSTKKILPLVFGLLLIPAASAATCTSKVISSGTTVGLSGCISAEGAAETIKALSATFDTLVIQSEGGDAAAAMYLARELSKHRFTLYVRGYCHSACANYVLPAANKVVVEEDAEVMLHGDARTTLLNYRDEGYLDPGLISLLIRLSAVDEKQFSESFPRAKFIHSMQKILLGSAKSRTEILYKEGRYLCPGLNMPYWVASPDELLTLGVIDQVSTQDKRLLPELVATKYALPMQTEFSFKSISDVCKHLPSLTPENRRKNT